MENAMTLAAGLLDDMNNEEYVRGMCELLAMMFPEDDVCTCDRAEWFTAKLADMVHRNNG